MAATATTISILHRETKLFISEHDRMGMTVAYHTGEGFFHLFGEGLPAFPVSCTFSWTVAELGVAGLYEMNFAIHMAQ